MVIFFPWRFLDVNERAVVFLEKNRDPETESTCLNVPREDLPGFKPCVTFFDTMLLHRNPLDTNIMALFLALISDYSEYLIRALADRSQ